MLKKIILHKPLYYKLISTLLSPLFRYSCLISPKWSFNRIPKDDIICVPHVHM